MKNRIASILTAMVVLLSSCVPVIATPMTTAQAAQALTASSDRISMDTQGDGIRYHLYQNENKQWDKFLNNSINTTFRACNIGAVYTMITYHTNTEDNSTEYIINKASLDALALHQDTVDEWAHFVTTQLFPDGTDRNTVLKLCYLHIARNYAYDREIVANDDRGKQLLATVYKGNIIKNLIMDCQSYTKYRPNETTGGIFVSWRRKEELPTGA